MPAFASLNEPAGPADPTRPLLLATGGCGHSCDRKRYRGGARRRSPVPGARARRRRRTRDLHCRAPRRARGGHRLAGRRPLRPRRRHVDRRHHRARARRRADAAARSSTSTSRSDDAIFAGSLAWTSVRRLFRAKYRSDGLETALRRVFGERLLGESRIPLVIPSYNLGENAVYLFKTPHHPRLEARLPRADVGGRDGDERRADVLPGVPPPGRGGPARRRRRLGEQPGHGRRDRGRQHVRLRARRRSASSASARRRASRRARASSTTRGLVRWVRGTNVVEVLLAGQSAGAFAQVQHLIGADERPPAEPAGAAVVASLDACDARELDRQGRSSQPACSRRLFQPCSRRTSPLRSSRSTALTQRQVPDAHV